MKVPTNKKRQRRRYRNATMRLVDPCRRREKAAPPPTMSPPLLEVGPTVDAASWGKRVGGSSPRGDGGDTTATPKWTADDFRMDGILGAGRFGRVYSAVLDLSGPKRRPVALKCLNKNNMNYQDTERLRREINIQSQ